MIDVAKLARGTIFPAAEIHSALKVMDLTESGIKALLVTAARTNVALPELVRMVRDITYRSPRTSVGRFKIYDKDPDMVRDTETLNVYILSRGALSRSGGPDPDEVWLEVFGEIERLDEAIQKAQQIAAEDGCHSKRLWNHLMGIELRSDEED